MKAVEPTGLRADQGPDIGGAKELGAPSMT